MSALVSDRIFEANRIIQAFASTKKRLFRDIETGKVSRFLIDKGNVIFYDAVNKKPVIVTNNMASLSVQRSMVHTGLVKDLGAYISLDAPIDPYWFGPWSDGFDLWALDVDDYLNLRKVAANSMAVATGLKNELPVSKRASIFTNKSLSSDKSVSVPEGDQLPFDNLKAVMPEVRDAQAQFNHIFDQVSKGGEPDAVVALEGAFRRFNVVLRKAFEAICQDTSHINNAKTLEMVFVPRNQLSTYFTCPSWGVEAYLDAVIATSSFNRNYHRQLEKEAELARETESEPSFGMRM